MQKKHRRTRGALADYLPSDLEVMSSNPTRQTPIERKCSLSENQMQVAKDDRLIMALLYWATLE